MLAERYPAVFKPWQNRIAELSTNKILDLLNRVPDAKMSDAARRFALRFIGVSRELVLKMS